MTGAKWSNGLRPAICGTSSASDERKIVKLYYSPFACSLADHIALQEAGAFFERETVDLETKQTASGHDFLAVSAKGYVPALVLDSGETLTENVAVLDWIASQYPALAVAGPLGRTRMLEVLSYISSEIHRSFKPMWHPGGDAEKAKARTTLAAQFELVADGLKTDYLFGNQLSVADCYLFVMLLWAARFHVPVPASLEALRTRMDARPAVRIAMTDEGLV